MKKEYLKHFLSKPQTFLLLAAIWYLFNIFSDDIEYLNTWQQNGSYQVHTTSFKEISRYKSGRTGYVYGLVISSYEYLSLDELGNYLDFPTMATLDLAKQGAGTAYFIKPYGSESGNGLLIGVDFANGNAYGSHNFPQDYYENRTFRTWQGIAIFIVVFLGVIGVVIKDYLQYCKQQN